MTTEKNKEHTHAPKKKKKPPKTELHSSLSAMDDGCDFILSQFLDTVETNYGGNLKHYCPEGKLGLLLNLQFHFTRSIRRRK
jgi:hypothetical protein